MTEWRLLFGGFALDLTTDRLLEGAVPVPLTPRDVAVLRCLAFRSGRIVSTDEILETVWGDLFVTRGVVKVAISRIRSALGDTTAQPRFIETVGHKGYRFAAPIERLSERSSMPEAPAGRSIPSGRDAELGRLHSLLDRALQGDRQIVFVTGEAGVGKTALVDAFLRGGDTPPEVIAVGRCIEPLEPLEPRFALFEALRGLCEGPMAAEVIAVLRRHAPLWLAQLPEFVSPAAREALAREGERAGHERMTREFADAAAALARLRPLALVLEDVQWSDRATLDVLSLLASRREPARLLVVATFQWDALADPGRSMVERLLERGRAEEVALQSARAERAATDPPECDDARRVLARTPLVGRAHELGRLERQLERTRASGAGGLALLAGEPGIGKTRLLDELAARARASGARVLSGRCFEGQSTRPYGGFADAIAVWAMDSDAETLRADLGPFASVVACIVPEVRTRLPDLPELPPLAPEDQRPRVLDALAQVLWAAARRAPLVLLLDDLHWADGETLTLLRHLARFLARHRVVVIGAYRNADPDASRSFRAAVSELRREIDLDRIELSGLDREAVAELLESVVAQPVSTRFVDALATETSGNPLFLRELLLHLVEQGRLASANDDAAGPRSLAEADLPHGVRELISQRLSRLPEATNRLLAGASGCTAAFRFDVAAAIASLDQGAALEALDAALGARLIRSASGPETYEFAHALIRRAIYLDMSPSRRVRLHRRLAKELERRADDHEGSAQEIARHYERSASLPGAERGVTHALRAADDAEQRGAHDAAAEMRRLALHLMPTNDPRRARTTARLALALAWAARGREAVPIAREAADLLATTEGRDAAADYLALFASAALDESAWDVAEQGLAFAGDRRDLTWALLRSYDLDRRDAEDPGHPGLLVETPDRKQAWRIMALHEEASRVTRSIHRDLAWAVFDSRREVIESALRDPGLMAMYVGDYRVALELYAEFFDAHLRSGRLVPVADNMPTRARTLAALGDLDAAAAELARAEELAERIGMAPGLIANVARLELAYARGDDIGAFAPVADALLRSSDRTIRPHAGFVHCLAACVFAFARREDDALRELRLLLPAIERAGGSANGYTAVICWAVESLWELHRADFADVLERNLREKTLAPDFRCVAVDARRALAKLCVLTDRSDEARAWFQRARDVLDEQEARPLRALVDLEEAEMELRRKAGTPVRAAGLIDAANEQFEKIGMHGWSTWARSLTR